MGNEALEWGWWELRVRVHETIVNLEMSGFLYTSMINVIHTHKEPWPMAVCGNSRQMNGNPQWSFILQRPIP